MSQNDDTQKGEGTNPNDMTQPNKPKKLRKLGGKLDPNRSKSAPIESYDEKEEENNNYIASYNYYLYYNSIKPVDPRLPKPTYTPKPNLEFIRESKPKDEEDEENAENMNLNTPVDKVTNDLEKLNLDMNPNSKNNKIQNDTKKSKDEDYEKFKMNYSSQNQNQKMSNQDAPSPFVDYYTNLEQQNDNHQFPGENINPQNIYQMNMPNMLPPNMKVPINPLYQVNPNINLYPNISPYGNIPPQIPMMNPRMNLVNNMGQNMNNKKNQKKGQMNNNPLEYQTPVNNNVFPEQRIGQFYPQPNPMLNMGLGMNYPPNEQNLRIAQQIAGYNKGGVVQNEANIPLTLNIPMNIPIKYQ